MADLKLYMILLGCKPPGRHVEQHDFFFGIGTSLKALIPEMTRFWPEAKGGIHIDGYREVNVVEDYQVKIIPKNPDEAELPGKKLFFINLGGYQENKFEEQHYTLLTAKNNAAQALREAKTTFFYKLNSFGKATSHIDDKYGIDVDDLYQIEDILTPSQKETYQLELVPGPGLPEDKINLGYFKFSTLV